MESYAATFIVPVPHYLMTAYITVLPKSVTHHLRQHQIFPISIACSTLNYITQFSFQVTCMFAKSITIRVKPCDLFLSTCLHNHIQKIAALLNATFSSTILQPAL